MEKEIKEDKLISCIMTAYNTENLIGEAIESLIKQTYKNLEIIIIDDCSTDSTLEKIKEHMKKDKRIRGFKSNINYGPFVGKNYGLKVAKGDYFIFHDSDDKCSENYIKYSYLNYLNNQSKVTFTACKVIHSKETLEKYGRGEDIESVRICNQSSFFGRDVFEEVGYFDSVRFGSDSEFRDRLIAYYDKLVGINLDLILYYYLKREGGLTCSKETGFNNGKNLVRETYRQNYTNYHKKIKSKEVSPYVSFPQTKFNYEYDNQMLNKYQVDLNKFEELK